MYTLLIADDEPLIRNGVKKIIDWESLGFSQIFLAEDGQEALDIIKSKHVDLVLTDIVMPFMDGLELSEILSREFPDIHVVILTGHEDFEYAQKSVSLGVKNYILKPIGAESLYKKMVQICEKLHIENKQRQYVFSMKSQLRQSMPVLREQTLNKIVCSENRDINLYLERAKNMNINLERGTYEVGVLDFDLDNISLADYDLYLFAAKNIARECLGEAHYVFEEGSNLEIVKTRSLELCSLLSRAAIEGGATSDSVLKINNQFLRSLQSINTLDDLCYQLQESVEVFTQCMFNYIPTKNNEIIKEAIRYISQTFAGNLTLEDVASHVHLNPAYFSTLFKQSTGSSFKEYLNMVRIEESKRLLINPEYSIIDVAMAVGFMDQSYFSKVFKKYTGLTPKQYR